MKKIRIFLIVFLLFVGMMIPANADFSATSFFTWLLGSIWSRPKNFERSHGAYVMIKLRTPERLKPVLGPTIYVDPNSKLGQMNEAGTKLYTLADFGWITDADVSFHKDRDRIVHKASVDIEFNPVTKSSGNVTSKMILWKEEFKNVNGAEIRVFPPRSVDPGVVEEWNRVVANSISTGEIILLTVNVKVDSPISMKAAQSFQVAVCPTVTLAKILGYRDQALGIAIQDGNKRQLEKIRKENGIPVTIRVAKNGKPYRAVGIAIHDSLGEVYRGKVSDKTEFRVVPEERMGSIRITRLPQEEALTMSPTGKVNPKTGKLSGCVKVSSGAKILISPIEGLVGYSQPQIIRGEVKIYGKKLVQISLSSEGEKTAIKTVKPGFGGCVLPVYTDKKQMYMMVVARTYGNINKKKLTSTNNQVIFDFEDRSPARNYSAINTNPAVPGGINTRDELIRYAQSEHFKDNVLATGVNRREFEIFRKKALRGDIGYTAVGPHIKRFEENNQEFYSTNLIKALTECGSDGRPVGHRAFYRTTFQSYHRVWVPNGRYGWVPGIISTCGNAVMVYIEPPKQQEKPPEIEEAPPSEIPWKLSWDNLIISTAGIRQGNLVITPSSISPYIPQAKTNIDIRQSQSQNQNQTSTNVNNNINNNTNINNTDININNTNNNINQNSNINNNANANN